MKTANKSSLRQNALCLSAVFFVALSSFSLTPRAGAYAADPVAPPPLDLPLAAQGEPVKNDMNKSLSLMEDKVSESAKNTLKRLDNSSDAMTLEELNSARQTVVRIEAMIEVEKRMVELNKLKNDRNGASSSAWAASLPPRALRPLPMPIAPIAMPELAPVFSPPVHIEKPKPNFGGIEVLRILGAEGQYSAVLQLSDGSKKSVRIGDHLSDGAIIRWIASSSVVLDEKGETRTLHIKNVNTVYSVMR